MNELEIVTKSAVAYYWPFQIAASFILAAGCIVVGRVIALAWPEPLAKNRQNESNL